MLRYKKQFEEGILKIFNRIQNKKMKESLMSVYGVLVGNTNTAGVCPFGYLEIVKRARKHKLSLSMLKTRLEKLESMGLIEIIKTKICDTRFKYSYKIVREVIFEDLQVCEVTVIDNNSIGSSEEICNFEDVESVNSITEPTIEINSLDELEAFMFEDIEDIKPVVKEVKAPNFKQEIATLEEVIDVAKIKFKELKITKEFVKNKVISRLKDVLKQKDIHKAGMQRYIETIITNEKLKDEAFSKRAILEVNGYYKNIKNKAKKGSFCNYQQREYTKEQWAEMEEYLIGW